MRGDILLIQEFLANYIQQIRIDDLRKYADSHSISYTEEELNIVYIFLKEHYADLIHHNTSVLIELKNKIHPDLYQKLFELYESYYQKYL